MAEPEHGALERWLVDGFNVLHVGILHGRKRGRWWGSEARAQLLNRIEGFAEPGELVVIFDGPDPEGDEELPASRARLLFAPSADDWILSEVKASEAPERLRIVTADRKLADRARHRGAQVLSPRAFLARCPLPETDEEAADHDRPEPSQP